MSAKASAAKREMLAERERLGLKHCSRCDRWLPLAAFGPPNHPRGDHRRYYCASCSILRPCETWSLSLAAHDTGAIYAGMTPAVRLRRKRELRREPGRCWPGVLPERDTRP